MMLPLLFDIFRPYLSTKKPCPTTILKGAGRPIATATQSEVWNQHWYWSSPSR